MDLHIIFIALMHFSVNCKVGAQNYSQSCFTLALQTKTALDENNTRATRVFCMKIKQLPFGGGVAGVEEDLDVLLLISSLVI